MRSVDLHSLLEWYRTTARPLPWRREPRDPYHVVVSEFMLQQTQVDRVVPRFDAFVERFPTFQSLAEASEEEVLTEWSGLGYYRRARMLHQMAGQVARRSGGLPRTFRELQELPGIGPYTAAAVASLAFAAAEPVLDGNVMRVGSRALALDEDPRSPGGRRRLEAWIRGMMEGQHPGEVNEALMELGATVCKSADPRCGDCPILGDCAAERLGRQTDYPPPRKRRRSEPLRWVAACVVDPEGSWLLRRVDTGPILRGLWLPPLRKLEDKADPVGEALQMPPFPVDSTATVGTPVRHNITHRRIVVIPVFFENPQQEPPEGDWRWIDPEDPGVPTSSLLQKLVEVRSGSSGYASSDLATSSMTS
jgi:A/G-specific adenine glycosylase